VKLLNGRWFWASEAIQAPSPDDARVAWGTIDISEIDNYTGHQQSPNAVISGEVREIDGVTHVAQPHFNATDIVIGRRAGGRFVYEWNYAGDGAGARSGVSILHINYSRPRASWRCLFLCGRSSIRNLTGRYYADQDVGIGVTHYFRSEAEATQKYDWMRQNSSPEAKRAA
jgi:hypothetical protein